MLQKIESILSKYLYRIILGGETNISLEKKIFLLSCFLGIFLSLFGMLINAALIKDINLVLLSLGFAVIFAFYFILAKKKADFQKHVNSFIALTTLSMTFLWFFNGGYDSANIILLFFFFYVSLVVSPKMNRSYLLIIYFLLSILLISAHYFFPQYINSYINKEQRYYDLLLSYPIFIIFYFVSISALVDNYQRERELVNSQKEELAFTLNQLEHSNEELKTLNESIERESYELLKLNDKLAISEHKLNVLNNKKDKFFSIIAHDIKNPLHGISLATQLLDMYLAGNEEAKETTKSINNIVNDLTTLLEDLLAWARSQSGTSEFLPERLVLNNLIDDNVNILKNIASYKEITIKYFCPNELYVNADLNMLNTILRNLISNSIKFTKQSGEIFINAEPFEEDSNFVLISVSDTGIGMSHEKMSKLFVFDSGKSEMGTAKEKGTGFGLMLCKDFIEKHGGNIWVESELRKGSRFYFTIPSATIAV